MGNLFQRSPMSNMNWASKVDYETGRPVETPFSRYLDANVYIMPMAGGGHNWQPMAFNPKTGLVYIPAIEHSMLYGQPKTWEFSEDARDWNVGLGFDESKPVLKDPKADKGFGKLLAWNPVEQKEAWVVEHPSFWNAGVLTTEELVFQGTAEGDFVAYDAMTGESLWSFPLDTGIIAAPATYLIDGIQYVTIAAGWGRCREEPKTSIPIRLIRVAFIPSPSEAKKNHPSFQSSLQRNLSIWILRRPKKH